MGDKWLTAIGIGRTHFRLYLHRATDSGFTVMGTGDGVWQM